MGREADAREARQIQVLVVHDPVDRKTTVNYNVSPRTAASVLAAGLQALIATKLQDVPAEPEPAEAKILRPNMIAVRQVDASRSRK